MTHGSDKLTWHQSSKQSQRGFCRDCGSKVFFKSTLAPGEVHIARSNIDGEIDRAPGMHIFHDSHVDWLILDDALPRYTRDSPGLAKYQSVEYTRTPR